MDEIRIKDIVGKNGKFALVGANSQGKTYALDEFYSKHKGTTIYIKNESKADEVLKNTTNSSPLVDWLERLLDINVVKSHIKEQLSSVEMDNVSKSSNLSISLVETVTSFKGMVSAQILTKSNQWGKPGSGETFMGELFLVEQMIERGNKNPIRYLIIDEPETFLHQSLYITVCDIMRRLSKKMVVIISTHSSDFLKAYCDDCSEIVYVRNGVLKRLLTDASYIEKIKRICIYSDKKYIDNMDKSTKYILGIIDSYFDKFIKCKIIECLFCNTVVVGEGFAEIALFDCFKSEYADDKILGDITFIQLSGKYLMPIYIYMLNEIGLNTVVLFDEDIRKENRWNTAINEYIRTYSTANYSFDEDIENYLGIVNESNKKSNYKTVVSPLNIQMRYLDLDEKLLSLLCTIKEKIESI